MPTEAELTLIRAAMRSPGVKVAGAYDKVYNDECVLSFDTPFSPTGLYVSLTTFQGFGEPHVMLDHERTGNALYVHFRARRVAKPPAAADADERPTQMAIGTPGGFQVDDDKYDVVKEHALVLLPSKLHVPLPCVELPELVSQAAQAIISHTSHLAEDKVAAIAWEAEVLPSKYAEDLIQLPPHKKISPDPSTWVCEESGMRENLWLNLSDGHIGSGRRQYDGSGGSNGALNHYQETKEHFPPSGFPLVVKLGTITPHGADVYSYADDENTEVTDPKLAEHLAHWGINMLSMEKTELSVAEMNIAANEKLELDKITEAGRELTPMTGPGLVGLRNLGNSCYINSVLQVLLSMPEFGLFSQAASAIFASAPADAPEDLLAQLAKLALGLLTTRYTPGGEGAEPSEDAGEAAVSPRMLKMILGKGHPEFSSARQQDALEYFQHLVQMLQRAEVAGSARLLPALSGPPPSALFNFTQEERIVSNGQVLYRSAPGQCHLSLTIPIDEASNAEEVAAYEERRKRRKVSGEAEAEKGDADKEEPIVPIVPFEACLSKTFAPETIDSFRGATATKTTRFKTFPRYLVVHMRRYYVDTDWSAKKMSVRVVAPDELDLTAFRSAGLQPDEVAMPDDQPDAGGGGGDARPAPMPDEAIVAQLVGMGFSDNGSKRAALAVSNSNAEAAMEWVFAHMEDPDFNEPLPPPGAEAAAATTGADPAAVESLCAMGFDERQAKGALAACSGNVERAADWIFSHMDDLEQAVAAALGETANAEGGGGAAAVSFPQAEDGSGMYELLGFVSHMGSNTGCGHYVCHIKKDGQWVIFNDRKVAASEATPVDLGYMYFYRAIPRG